MSTVLFSNCAVNSYRGNLVIRDSNGYVIASVAWYTQRPLGMDLVVYYD